MNIYEIVYTEIDDEGNERIANEARQEKDIKDDFRTPEWEYWYHRNREMMW